MWSGSINMPDVARFSVTAKAVSGHTDYLTEDLKSDVRIVGRIQPKTVWDYIKQIKENSNKEVLLIKFLPEDSEKANYESFFDYLQNRNRLAVAHNTSKMVKDCYVMPLGKEDDLDPCLLPLDGPGLADEAAAKRNLLLGLIVRTRRKRPGDDQPTPAAVAASHKMPPPEVSKEPVQVG